MKSSFLLNIVVPVYNEEAVVKKFFIVLIKHIKQYNYKIIFVDDGSTDNTLEILLALMRTNKAIVVIKLKRNFGQQNAIFTGLSHAKGDCTVVMDADMQDSPRYINKMIDKWLLGNKIVFTKRKSRSDSWTKKLFAYLFYRVYKLTTNKEAVLDGGDFYLLDKKVIKNVISDSRSKYFLRGAIARNKSKRDFVLINRKPRIYGKTKYPIQKMLKLAFYAFLQSKLKSDNKSAKYYIDKVFYGEKRETTP